MRVSGKFCSETERGRSRCRNHREQCRRLATSAFSMRSSIDYCCRTVFSVISSSNLSGEIPCLSRAEITTLHRRPDPQLRREQIHANAQIGEANFCPLRCGPARLVDDPVTHFLRDRAVLEHADERMWKQHPVLRMVPSGAELRLRPAMNPSMPPEADTGVRIPRSPVPVSVRCPADAAVPRCSASRAQRKFERHAPAFRAIQREIGTGE